MLDLLIVRGIFILVLTISAYALHPFHSSPWMAAAGGTIFGLCIIFFEMRLERVSLKRLIGAACGSVLGIVGAKKGDMLNLSALGGIFGGEKSSRKSHKILDTSVIIDGRIADIAETGF